MTDESSVFQETYVLLKRIHLLRNKFSKSEKYSLGQSLEESVLQSLQEIIEAGLQKLEWKVATIEKSLRWMERTKILMRLAKDLDQIRERDAIEIQESIQKIGRMLGGWKKSI